MNAHDIGALVKTGRVHRRVYADPEIFELEMERLFGRAWLFVGHESQVQAPGDFFTTYMGRQPVVVVRHEDGAVHVLNNRCGHRGTQVVGESSGNATNFTCCMAGSTAPTAVCTRCPCARDTAKKSIWTIRLSAWSGFPAPIAIAASFSPASPKMVPASGIFLGT